MQRTIHHPGGISTTIAVQDGAMVYGSTQDCTALAEYTKARQNEGHHGSKDMRLAATVPNVFIEKYLHDNGITLHEFTSNAEHKKRLLNDPAIAHFRIWRGRV